MIDLARERKRSPDIDLAGLIDIHVHSAPDVRPRVQDDVQVARSASDAGMRAVMLKSHVTSTADRAAIAGKLVPGIRVCGGLVLNREIGGLNPSAVEAAIRMGARQIWMPTSSAAHDVAYQRRQGRSPSAREGNGISTIGEDGALLPIVREIIQLAAEAGVALSSAHLAPQEVVLLVAAARRQGLQHMLVTHPEHAISRMPLDVQRSLAQAGVWFEHCFASTLYGEPVPLAEIAARIRAIGAAHIVLSTDLGLIGRPLPVDGMRLYLSGLLELGIPWTDLVLMTRENPARLLGL